MSFALLAASFPRGGIGAERDVNGSFPRTGVDQLRGESQREPVLLLARGEIVGAEGSNDTGQVKGQGEIMGGGRVAVGGDGSGKNGSARDRVSRI